MVTSPPMMGSREQRAGTGRKLINSVAGELRSCQMAEKVLCKNRVPSKTGSSVPAKEGGGKTLSRHLCHASEWGRPCLSYQYQPAL